MHVSALRFRLYILSALAVVVFVFSAAASFPALAATPEEIIRAQSERIQREEQLRQQQQFEETRKSSRAPARIDVPAPRSPRATSGTCRQIQKIDIVGANTLDNDDRERLIRSYQSRCLVVADIEMLLADITRDYIARGFIASRAYVPAQDLSQGKLEILVIEGRVSRVESAPGKGRSGPVPDLWWHNLFPCVLNDPLNLRDFEQGLDQLNRLTSNDATLSIRPGKYPGDSEVVIHNSPGKPWHVNLSADNHGTESTGREQGGLTGSIDNALGVNDFVSITRRQSIPDKDGEGSSSENYSVNIPYGYSLWSVGHSDSRYESTIKLPSGLSSETSGSSHVTFVRVDHVVWRDQTQRVGISAALNHKEFNNYFAGIRLEVASRTLVVADVAANYNASLGGGTVDMEIGYSRGLNEFNALRDMDDLPGDAPRAQFEKYFYGVGYSYPFLWLDRQASVSSRVTGQHSLDALYGSEQIAIGGIYSVRGFYEGSLAGDDGIFLRNELALRQPAGDLFGYNAILRPYVAIDGGKVQSVASGSPEGTLVGAALGAGVMAGPLVFDAFVGHPLRDGDVVPDEGANAFARVSYSF